MVSNNFRCVSGIQRQDDRECRAFTKGTSDENLSLVRRDNFLSNGEPKPCASASPHSSFFDLDELFKDACEVFARNAFAMIPNGNVNLLVYPVYRKLEAVAARAITNAVAE